RATRRPLEERDPNVQNLHPRPAKRARRHSPAVNGPSTIREDVEHSPERRRQRIEVQAPPRRPPSASRRSPLAYHTPPTPEQQRQDRRRRREELREPKGQQEHLEQQEQEERRHQAAAARRALAEEACQEGLQEAADKLLNGRTTRGRHRTAGPLRGRPPTRAEAGLIQNSPPPLCKILVGWISAAEIVRRST
ncbi:MAG: hypothetical protein Q9187_009190, partial [Circinaria calcarea]